MKKKIMLLCALSCVLPAIRADVVARYNFNGRTKDGQSITRLKADGPAKDKMAPDYVPNAEQKECGPALKCPLSLDKYYRVSYVKDGKREILEQRIGHGHHPSGYYAPAAESKAPLKEFTLEMVVAIDNSLGVSTGGKKNYAVLFDNGQEQLMVYDTDIKLGVYTLGIVSGKTFKRIPNLKIGQYYQFVLTADADGGVTFYLDGEKKEELMTPAKSTRVAGFGLGYKAEKSPYQHPSGFLAFKLDDLVLSNKVLDKKDWITVK